MRAFQVHLNIVGQSYLASCCRTRKDFREDWTMMLHIDPHQSPTVDVTTNHEEPTTPSPPGPGASLG